jgi:HK97 family phage major capsid protein
MDEIQLKALIEKAAEKILAGDLKQIQATLNEIKGWGADNGRLKQAEDAVKQLEQQYKTSLADLDQKLAAAARRAYDLHGNYRGGFGSEEQARTFALCVMARTGDDSMRKRSLEILNADHKAFMGAYAKDITGDQALIPHEHTSRIERLVEDSSVWARNAFMMPMTTPEASFTRRVSGMRAHKTKIRTAVDKQNMTVAPISLTAADYDILTSYPKQLEADALIAVAELLLQEMSLGFSIMLEENGLIGDGTDTYDNETGITFLLKEINGVNDGGGLVLGSGAAGSGWTGIGKDDILKAIGQARHVRPGQGVLVCSNEFYWQRLAKIITDAGGVTRSEIEGRPGLQVFGTPVEISHVMPRSTGNSQIAAIYGDIGLSSTHGSRQQLTIETSREAYFTSKEIGVLATARHAINNHTLGDATTPGPVVGIITPAAG